MANLFDDVPAIEPERITAGDTIKWTRADLLPDYPAADYALAFVMVAAGGNPTTVTAAAGEFVISAAASAALAAGRYQTALIVTKIATGEKATLATGVVVVEPGLASANGATELRSHARRVLEALEAAIERRATSSHLEVELSDGRRVRHMTLEEQIAARDRYRREVRAEEIAAAAAKGKASPRVLKVRL